MFWVIILTASAVDAHCLHNAMAAHRHALQIARVFGSAVEYADRVYIIDWRTL